MSSNTAPSSSGGAGSADATSTRRHSKRPKYSRFTQQELPACKPILTPRWVISAFMLISIVFIPIGVASLFASRDVVEIIDRYETDCIPASSRTDKVRFIQSPGPKKCNRTLKVSKRMKQPIYVYYQLDNFYQNHRRYVIYLSHDPAFMFNMVDAKTFMQTVNERGGSNYCKAKILSWLYWTLDVCRPYVNRAVGRPGSMESLIAHNDMWSKEQHDFEIVSGILIML